MYRKEENLKKTTNQWRKLKLFMNSILYKGKNEGKNLKSEKYQDYSQKP
jgi:hypothetical protein